MKAGIVVQNLQARFDERFNHCLVLTTENDILQVKPIDVKFQLHQFIPNNFVNFDSIVLQRHDLNHKDRQLTLKCLESLIHESKIFKRKTSATFNNLFSQFAQDQVTPVTILDIVDAIRLRESDLMRIASSLFWQHVFLYSIHWNIIDSTSWLAPNYFEVNTASNLALWHHSNNCHSASHYYVNSRAIQSKVNQMLKNFEGQHYVNEVLEFLRNIRGMSKEELNIYLKVFEGRHHSYIIEVMKFAIIYPHDSIMRQLSKLDLSNVSDIYNLLVELKIYDSDTDIYLSSGLFGSPTQMSVSNSSQLSNRASPIFNPKDNFKYLRTKKFYHDHVIYGLGNDESTQFGISIETLNSRKYIINVHIPDLISFMPPNSSLFQNIFGSSIIRRKIDYNNGSLNELYSNEFKAKRRFKTYANYVENDEVWENIDKPKKKRRNISEATCLTISFELNSFDLKAFDSFKGKINISFDSISNVNVKNVNMKTLQKCLTGELEPSFFKLLRINRNMENVESDVRLNKVDIHNLNYIFHVMKSFFKSRQMAGAASVGLKSEAGFLLDEIKIFTGCLVAEFCSEHNIPVINRSQSLDSIDYNQDKVHVEHDNMLFPAFDSEKYSHSIMARNINGNISESAKIISNNYLSPIKKSLTSFEQNTPLGLRRGFVDIFTIFDSGEALLNQFQLLSYTHYINTIQMCPVDQIQNFHQFKRIGYNLRGPLSQSQLSSLIKPDSKIWEYLLNKYEKLKILQINKSKLQCIVTSVIKKDLNQVVCRAYCFKRGIELKVISYRQDIKIGSVVKVEEPLVIDFIEGECIYIEAMDNL
ncbi:uncharacterized protein KGF55_000230 [Candida pseudojiufengensis]|uniref:uncharacterized protein n=1 Tax=Candida pseudojiufengensis TaxID=497109 RepID=UPI0022245F43|nr:uncharacterized protein KGF55_000230 [Candida pseudojiufengensis]KAI5966821.1 hypothetical protein KGF55_000230 [Candida pseudojiufengensis]